jgi:hypothetical protein
VVRCGVVRDGTIRGKKIVVRCYSAGLSNNGFILRVFCDRFASILRSLCVYDCVCFAIALRVCLRLSLLFPEYFPSILRSPCEIFAFFLPVSLCVCLQVCLQVLCVLQVFFKSDLRSLF